MHNDTRIPKQKRSIEKYEKIINSGWYLITKNGYHNTNTKEIADYAKVSTGIIYQYFNDKHDILIAGIHKYGDNIFFPMIKQNINISSIEDFSKIINSLINKYIKDHKISKKVHEEIMSMVHTDEQIARYYYNREMNITNSIYNMLIKNNIKDDNLKEKVHIIIGMIDNLCHEIVYHKHKEINYQTMTNLVVENINNLLKG